MVGWRTGWLMMGLILVGCSGGNPTDSATERAIPEPAAEPAAGPAGDSNEPVGDSTEPAEPGGLGRLSGVIELNGRQSRDDSGVVVTLERLVIEPSYVVLVFTAINGSTGKVALAGDSDNGLVLEVDDPAVVMTYQAPSVNESLELASGEVLEAEIVFVGALTAGVSSMDITFNPDRRPLDRAAEGGEGVDPEGAGDNGGEPDGEVAEPTIHFAGVPLPPGPDR